jgi:hypothetical protein
VLIYVLNLILVKNIWTKKSPKINDIIPLNIHYLEKKLKNYWIVLETFIYCLLVDSVIGVENSFQQYFSYFVVVRFIGEGNWIPPGENCRMATSG